MEGMNFAMEQLTSGVSAFAPVLPTEADVFLDQATEEQVEQEEQESENEDEDEDDDDKDEDEDDEKEGIKDDNESVDAVLHALHRIEVAPGSPLSYEILAPGVHICRFPRTICQGRYKGRNGSNACSVISLLMSYAITKRNIRIQACQTPPELPNTIVDVLCGCIELGNEIYDICRASLPSRYISIEEASTLLRAWFDSSVGDALPVRLRDDHDMSTVCGQLSLNASSHDFITAHIIINEKTSLYHFSNNNVMYIDTHSHGSNGSVIVVAKVSDIQRFCKEVWNLEGHDESTFGNLVFVNFQ